MSTSTFFSNGAMKTWFNTSVRAKIILVVMLVMLVTNVVVYGLARSIILTSYIDIEHREMTQYLRQAHDAFENHVATMRGKIKDWAFWDDSYIYMEDPVANADFATDNLLDNTLLNMEINVLIYTDRDGKVAFKKVVDTQTKTEILDSRIVEHILEHPQTLMPLTAGSSSIAHGTILIPEGPVQIVSVPVLQNSEMGPMHGTLIFGTFVDDILTEKTTHLTHLPVRIYPLNNTVPQDVMFALSQLTQENNHMVQPISNTVVTGYTAVYDMDGKPAYVIRVDKERELYQQGNTIFLWFMASMSAALLLFGLAVIWFLERYIIARLAKLNRQVRDIGTAHDLTVRVDARAKDEVGELGRAINTMLIDLSTAHEKEAELDKLEKEATAKLKERLGEIEQMNRVMTGREMRMVELKETIKELRKRLGEPDIDIP